MMVGDIKWWHRIRLPDGTYTPGIVRHGEDGGDWPQTRFGITADLVRGKTVLDVGGWDGFFSFEAERLGASHVLCTDATVNEGGNWAGTAGFCEAKRLLNSRVDWTHLDIQSVESVSNIHPRDVVMCFGVLYHLKSPLIAMEHLARLTIKTCLIETEINESDSCALFYRPRHAGDSTNYFYPTIGWIESAAREVGFKSSSVVSRGTRSTIMVNK